MEGNKIQADVLYRLIAKLTMNSKEILDKFAFYLQNPVQYAQSEYGEFLSFDEEEIEELLEDEDENFKKFYPEDVMEGLLRVEKYMWKVDHREFLDGIEYAVNALLARKGLPELKLQLEKKDMSSYAFLNAIGEILNGMDLQLAYMDDGSDGFPLIVVHKKDMAEITDLANQAGWPVKTYFA